MTHKKIKAKNHKQYHTRQSQIKLRRAVHSHHPRRRRNVPFCCLTLFAANALQCIVIGEENPKTAPFPCDFVTLPEEDRATAIGNMHKKFGKDRACDWEISSRTDRQRHKQTDVLITILRHRCRGEVIIVICMIQSTSTSSDIF